MHWYWWVALGLACWTVLPAIALGPTLGKLLARRAEEQLVPLPHVPSDDELGVRELERVLAEHRKQRRREPTE